MYYEIEQFFSNTDPVVTVKDPFGNGTVQMQDWFPALRRAQSQWISVDPKGEEFNTSMRGFSIYLGPREYYFSDSIQLIRGMSLIGSGGTDELEGTVLIFPPGKHGIVCNDSTTSPSNTLGTASGSLVERLRIWGGNYGSAPDQTVSHGILVKDTIVIRDCAIQYFSGDGIHIEAYTGTTPFLFQATTGGTSNYVEPAALETPPLPSPPPVNDGTVQWTYREWTTWQSGTYITNQFVAPTTRNGYVFQCIQPGTSLDEPNPWPTKVGDTVPPCSAPSGTAQFKCIGTDDSWKPHEQYAEDDTIVTNKISDANDWQIQNCLVQFCENGLFVKGSDVSAGCAIALHCDSNRAWGIIDNSFLGNTYIACHMAGNTQGPYYIPANNLAGCLINCYSESGQPPSYFGQGVSLIGGQHAAGFTPNSTYFGGPSYNSLHSMTALSVGNFAVPTDPDFSPVDPDFPWSSPFLPSIGTNPPNVVLGGIYPTYQKIDSVDIRIKVTNPGVLGATPAPTVQWSIHNDTSNHPIWNGIDVDLPANPGTGIPLGYSGLWVYFMPGTYSADNTWGAVGLGGLQTQFTIGSNNGTMSAFSWGHFNTADPKADPYTWQMIFIDSNPANGFLNYQGRWALQYEENLGNSSMYFSSNRALPFPGTVSFDNLWYGGRQDKSEERRITSAVASSGQPGSEPWTGSAGKVAWWIPGDIIFNRDESVRWPLAWRPTMRGGVGGSSWQPDNEYYAGETVDPGNGYIYRGTTYGETGDSQPIWPVPTVQDGTTTPIVWQCTGPGASTALDAVLWQPNHSYSSGDTLQPGNGYTYTALNSGESGDLQPAWPLLMPPSGFELKVQDGTPIVWQCTGPGPSSTLSDWHINYQYDSGANVHPGNGYTYTALNKGESGNSPPAWPLPIPGDPEPTVQDRYPQVWEWFGIGPTDWQPDHHYNSHDTLQWVGNGYTYTATNSGQSGQYQPVWPIPSAGTSQPTVQDGELVWQYTGPGPTSPDTASAPPIFEPILDCAPTMLEKDCSVLPNPPTIILSDDEIAHVRYKLTGTPSSDFSVVIGSGVAGSWDRVVFNATGQSATIMASSSDTTGIPIPGINGANPSGQAYRLLNDGSNIIRVQ